MASSTSSAKAPKHRQAVPRSLRLALLIILAVAPALVYGANAGGSPPTEFVVGFEALPRDLQVGEEWNHGIVQHTNGVLHFAVIQTDSPDQFAEQAGRQANVTYVEENTVQNWLAVTPNDPSWDLQYGPRQVRTDLAWTTTTGSPDRNVCVVDTGVRLNHEDIQPNWVDGTDIVSPGTLPWDENGHGTHVAGIAAARTNNARGIAGITQAGILGVRVLSASGSGSLTDVAEGIQWCADNDGHIINLSLGGSWNSVLKEAVQYAWAQGSLLVAAAGNDGPCSDCVLYPAAFDEVMAVTCTTQERSQCSFSSDGPQSELAAPGDSILSTYSTATDAYKVLSGTSMSAPHVSGVAGLVWSHVPHLSNRDIREVLTQSAQDLGTAGWDQQFGYGLVDAEAALAATPSNTAPGPLIEALREDFDDGVADGWTLDGLWHVDQACNTPPSAPMYLGYHVSGVCNFVTGIQRNVGNAQFSVDLSEAVWANITFAHHWDTETATANFDSMAFQAKPSSGESWTTLLRWDARDPDPVAWQRASASMHSYLGERVDVRFRFDSMDGFNNGDHGWHVDNVRVLTVENFAPWARAGPDIVVSDGESDGVETVSVDGSSSFDPDGTIASYEWVLDDTVVATEPQAFVEVPAGVHELKLVVTDMEGATGSDVLQVSVLPNIPPVVDFGRNLTVADVDGDGVALVSLVGDGLSNAPIVFAQVQTDSRETVTRNVQVANAETDAFTLEFCAQVKKDRCGSHGYETTAWWAIDPTALPSAPGFEHGIVTIEDSTWTPISFTQPFVQTPIVLVMVQTDNGPEEALYGEVDAVSTAGALVRYCEANGDAVCDTHDAETLAWIAVEPGPVVVQGVEIGLAGTYATQPNGVYGAATFERPFARPPLVFVTTQTTNDDADPSIAQVRTVSTGGFWTNHCRWIEGQGCGLHPAETNGWLALDPLEANRIAGGLVGTSGFRSTPTNPFGTLHSVGLPQATDEDGTVVSYQWSVDGQPVASSPRAVLSLPIGSHQVTLTVTDNGGNAAAATGTVEVVANQPPVADAGPPLSNIDSDGDGYAIVRLDGTRSHDANGSIEAFAWYDQGAIISTKPQVDISFPVGRHDITLAVTDQAGATSTDVTTVTIDPNRLPIADAGPSHVTTDSDGDGVETVSMDGTGSSDPDGTVVAWEWYDGATLIATGPTPEVTFAVGSHTVTLTVTDNGGSSGTDTTMVTVHANQAPEIELGTDRTVVDMDADGYENLTLSATGFAASPLVFAQAQTDNDSGVRNVQVQGATKERFTIEFCDQASTDACGAHGVETVSWWAIDPTRFDAPVSFGTTSSLGGEWVAIAFPTPFDTTPVVLAMTQTENGEEEALYAEVDSVTTAGARVRFCESDGGSTCDAHTTETLAWLAVEPGPMTIDGRVVGYAGVQSGLENANWAEVKLPQPAIATPHVFATTQTTTGANHPSQAHIRLVTPAGFETQHCQYDQGIPCGASPAETNGWVAIDPMSASALPGSLMGHIEVLGTEGSSGDLFDVQLPYARDPDGTLVAYEWYVDDVLVGNQAQLEHRYALGEHDVRVVVTDDGGASSSDALVVSVTNGPPPIAAAGPDQLLSDHDGDGFELVTLDGSGSVAPGGSITAYEWSENGTILATGASPVVGLGSGGHLVTLEITDDRGNRATDTVVITVRGNVPPLAEAGPDQLHRDIDGNGVEVVELNASASSDADGELVEYRWVLDANTLATGPTASVEVPVGSNTITLLVTDDGDATASDTVLVTVLANQPPVASAGPDILTSDADANGTEAILLDASASYDPDGSIVDYSWIEGGATIASGVSPEVHLAVGRHTITLSVEDDGGASHTDDIVVEILDNFAPVAYFTATCEGTTCVLDSTGSTDPDGIVVDHAWDLGEAGLGTGATIEVSWPSPGPRPITLVVTDDDGDTDSMSLVIELTYLTSLNESFDDRPLGWVMADLDGPASWSPTNVRAASQPRSMAVRAYGEYEFDILTSPPVDLSNHVHPLLQFSAWLDGESLCTVECEPHDYLSVETSIDGGATWTVRWNDLWTTNRNWQSVSAALDDLAGELVQVRFVVRSNDIVEGAGFFLDDVALVDQATVVHDPLLVAQDLAHDEHGPSGSSLPEQDLLGLSVWHQDDGDLVLALELREATALRPPITEASSAAIWGARWSDAGVLRSVELTAGPRSRSCELRHETGGSLVVDATVLCLATIGVPGRLDLIIPAATVETVGLGPPFDFDGLTAYTSLLYGVPPESPTGVGSGARWTTDQTAPGYVFVESREGDMSAPPIQLMAWPTPRSGGK